MAGVFNGMNTLTHPTNTNGTPSHRESNGCDSPAKDVLDALSAPGSGWPSYGLDFKCTGLEDSHSGTSVSGSHFLGHCPSTHRDLDEDVSCASTEINLPCSVDHALQDVHDLLEEDLAFRLAERSGGQYSSVGRGLDTNLAELQVAGDILGQSSAALEYEWSRLSTPALSVTSEISDEASLCIPSTPLNEHYVVPAAIVAGDPLTPPPAETLTPQEPGPSEESKTLVSQFSADERKLALSGKKRKRDTTEVSDTRESSPEAPSQGDEEKWHKWFRIEGRGKSRHSLQSEVTIHTKYGESCRARVGDAGYCQFQWCRDGTTKKCGIELIRDRDILAAHFALHFEDLRYHTMAENNPEWRPRCPWCNKRATTFDNFIRHVTYSELEINATLCGCGGSINRGNQVRFRARHEQTKKHQEWVTRSRVDVAESDEPDEQREEFVEGSSGGTERRGSRAKVTQAAEEEEVDEEQEKFVDGSGTGTTRQSLGLRKMKAVVKEEADEEQDVLIQSRSTGATRKRAKAKKMKADANEDPDEEQEEFVEGSSTGAKRRRLS